MDVFSVSVVTVVRLNQCGAHSLVLDWLDYERFMLIFKDREIMFTSVHFAERRKINK